MALLHFPNSLNACSRRTNGSKGNNVTLSNLTAARCAAPTLRRVQPSGRQFVNAATATAEVAGIDAGAASSDAADTQQQQRKAPKQQQERAIVVGEKPAANSLLRRLEQVPQTTLRAISNSEQHTYKAITTVAIAQGQLTDPSKVLLYVPFTKSRAFTAIVLPTSSRVLQRSATLGGANTSSSSSIPRLQVKRDTDADALAKTLSFELIKHGTASLESSGAAATAHAAAALQAVRQQMLSRGYELGVVPRFEEQKITVLRQQVVLQELPVPRVTLPRNDTKPLDAAAAAANSMLAKQRRVQLLLPPTQLTRLSGLLAQVIQPPAAAAAAAVGDDKSEQQAVKGRGRGSRAQQEKRRLLLVWPPSTADQLLESLEQLNQFATAAMTEANPAAAAAGAGTEPAADSAAAAAPADPAAAGDVTPLLQLQLRRSRLVSIPTPQDAGISGAGLGADRKPAVATAESSVSGLAGAIEARVARAGAAWLWSDGSEQAHATAWQALLLASSKMDANDGAGGLLALVDVQPLQQQQQQPATAAAAEQQEQPQAEAKQQQEQQQQRRGKGAEQRRRQQQQQEQRQSYKLKMLIVRDSDIARSILQSPNSPLEVSVTADLWPLLKFATAANTFLPVAAATGTGGLVMLPAVLPAVPAEPAPVAVDYRFDDAKQQLVPYAIRLQRFTGNLPQGMEVGESQQLRVSLSTDPIKLRDAIVAKVLQQQPASVRFVGPLGRAPPLLTIAMAAVAAARVRLQQKGAPMDVGVMPYAETLTGPAAASAAGGVEGSEVEGAAAAAGGGKRKGAGRRQQSSAGGSAQAGRVVYSLRLVPMPAVAAAAAGGVAAAAEQKEAAAAPENSGSSA